MPKTVYKNRVFRVEKLNIRRKGKRFTQYMVNYKTPVVVILPISGKDVIIERQYRGALQKCLYEIPAGRVDKGESIASCARRELIEETGYRTANLRLMLKDYPSPGIMSSMRHYSVATGLKKGRSSPNKDEDIVVKRMEMKRVVQLIKAHKITDSKTITAILFYNLLKNKR